MTACRAFNRLGVAIMALAIAWQATASAAAPRAPRRNVPSLYGEVHGAANSARITATYGSNAEGGPSRASAITAAKPSDSKAAASLRNVLTLTFASRAASNGVIPSPRK